MSNTKAQSIKIIIGGDLCPIGRNEPLFCEGTAREIMGNLLPIWMDADYRIVNLECPLIATPAPIKKTGPHLAADESAVNGLKALGINVVGIANNHILDHGADGLLNTVRLCRENGMAVVGAGANLSEAREALILSVKGVCLGIIAMADLEWSIADNNSAGANPYSMYGFLKVMRRLRNECDHIIALLHMGKEHYPYPSPNLQEICRSMVEESVSVVVCQHSHCVGACESYEGGFICYGQGNLIFDSPKSRIDSWRMGHLLEVLLSPGAKPAVKSIPYAQHQNGMGIDSPGPIEVEAFHSQLRLMEREIQDAEFVWRKWSEFCKEKRSLCFSILAGHGRLRRRLNRLTGLTEFLHASEAIAVLENVLRCEAHREVIHEVLRNYRIERWTKR